MKIEMWKESAAERQRVIRTPGNRDGRIRDMGRQREENYRKIEG